jgi:hypothetical protein
MCSGCGETEAGASAEPDSVEVDNKRGRDRRSRDTHTVGILYGSHHLFFFLKTVHQTSGLLWMGVVGTGQRQTPWGLSPLHPREK